VRRGARGGARRAAGDPGRLGSPDRNQVRIPSDWLVKSRAFLLWLLGAPQWRYLGPKGPLTKTEVRTRSSLVKGPSLTGGMARYTGGSSPSARSSALSEVNMTLHRE
jgi:hypothetical protein